MRRALTINVTTPQGDSAKININYVGNTATHQKLFEFASALVALTSNTFVSLDLTTVEEIQGE